MATREIQAKGFKHLSNVLKSRIDETFSQVRTRKSSSSPFWLFLIYNEFINVVEGYKLSLKERKATLHEISKKLFVETARNIDLETALVVNKKR